MAHHGRGQNPCHLCEHCSHILEKHGKDLHLPEIKVTDLVEMLSNLQIEFLPMFELRRPLPTTTFEPVFLAQVVTEIQAKYIRNVFSENETCYIHSKWISVYSPYTGHTHKARRAYGAQIRVVMNVSNEKREVKSV